MRQAGGQPQSIASNRLANSSMRHLRAVQDTVHASTRCRALPHLVRCVHTLTHDSLRTQRIANLPTFKYYQPGDRNGVVFKPAQRSKDLLQKWVETRLGVSDALDQERKRGRSRNLGPLHHIIA